MSIATLKTMPRQTPRSVVPTNLKLRLIATLRRDTWCKHREAESGSGRVVFCDSPSARSWSFSGAVYHVTGGSELYNVVMDRARAILQGTHPEDFNDDSATTFEEVRGLIERL